MIQLIDDFFYQELMFKWMWNMEDVDAQLGDRVEDAREREVESVDKENVETKENRRRKWSLTKWRLNR